MIQTTKKERRQKQLNLSFTVKEYEALRQRADAVGARLVDFGRARLLGKSVTVRAVSEVQVSTTERLLFNQLSRLGNLLNQAVRYCHRTGHPLPDDLEPLLDDIRAALLRRHNHGS